MCVHSLYLIDLHVIVYKQKHVYMTSCATYIIHCICFSVYIMLCSTNFNLFLVLINVHIVHLFLFLDMRMILILLTVFA